MQIKTVEDRDNVLHALYQDKNYHVFFFGVESFNNKVQQVHKEWVNGIGPYADEWANDMVIEQTIWEIDNGYLNE